jgi:hypothetical protein
MRTYQPNLDGLEGKIYHKSFYFELDKSHGSAITDDVIQIGEYNSSDSLF